MAGETSSLFEFGVVMTVYVVGGTALAMFIWRAIRLAEAEGRADRKRLWRIALLKALLALFVLSLASLPLSFVAVMFLLTIPSVWLPWFAPDSAALKLFGSGTFLGFLVMVLSAHAMLWLMDAQLFSATCRSFPVLRAAGTRWHALIAWIRRRRAMIGLRRLAQRYNRRIW